MKFGSVCSGVEAASLAWMPLGWECKFVSEIEPFPCAVLQHRFGASAPINQLDPNEIIITDEEWALIDALKKVNKDWMKACDNADLISRFKERKQREAWIKDNALLNKEGKIPNEGDFTKIGKKYAGQIDLLVGGTPCQDISIAGKRAGFDGERSSLALDFVQLAYESQCKWFVWENVPGVFSSNEGRDFATLLSLFTGSKVEVPKDGWGTAGFVCNARRDRYGVAWRTLDGQFTRTQRFPFAVPQRRRRVFLVGYFGDWTRAAEVLLESGRSKWDTPSHFKAREIFAEIARADSALADRALRGTGEGSTDRHWDASGVNPTLNQCNAGSGTPGASNQELFSQNFNGLVTSIGNGQVDGLINPPELAQTLNCMHDQQAVLCYKNHMPDKARLQCVIEQKTASGASFEINYGCPVEEELSHTLKCGTAPGSYSGVIETAVGCDMYNHALTGDASKTLNSAATDSDHVPTVISAYNGAGDECGEITPTLQANLGKLLSNPTPVICRATQQSNAETMVEACPTITEAAGTSGNNQPIICLNDQGGSVMSVESDGNAGTLRANTHGNEQIVCGDLVQTLKIRSGCEGGGKEALVQDELSATLGCGNDQTLFVVHGAQNPDVISMHNKQFGQCEAQLSINYKEPQYSGFHKEEIAKTLDTTDPNPSKNQGGNVIVSYDCYNQADCGDVARTLSTEHHGTNLNVIAIDGDKMGKAERKGGSGMGVSEKDVMYTQTAKDVHAVCTNGINSTVRRLLPIECERLMGFSDNHTRIPWKGLKEEDCPDSPRYKACGNSMCVNVMQWIGEQIDKVEKRK